MSRRTVLKQLNTNQCSHYLVYWLEESSVSTVPAKTVVFPEAVRHCSLEKGTVCTVKLFGKLHQGKIAGRGSQKEMEMLEEQYLEGIYNPFDESSDSDGSSKSPTPPPKLPPPKKKRKTAKSQSANREKENKAGKKAQPKTQPKKMATRKKSGGGITILRVGADVESSLSTTILSVTTTIPATTNTTVVPSDAPTLSTNVSSATPTLTVTVPSVTPALPTTVPSVTPALPPTLPPTVSSVALTLPSTVPSDTPALPTTVPSVTPALPTTVLSVTPALPPTLPPTVSSVALTLPSTIPSVTPALPTTVPSVTPALPSTLPPTVSSVALTLPSTVPSLTPALPTTVPSVTPALPPTLPPTVSSVAPTLPSVTPTVLSTVPSVTPTVPSVTPALPTTMPSAILPAVANTTSFLSSSVMLDSTELSTWDDPGSVWDHYCISRTPSPLPPPCPPVPSMLSLDERLRQVEHTQFTILNRLQIIDSLLQQVSVQRFQSAPSTSSQYSRSHEITPVRPHHISRNSHHVVSNPSTRISSDSMSHENIILQTETTTPGVLPSTLTTTTNQTLHDSNPTIPTGPPSAHPTANHTPHAPNPTTPTVPLSAHTTTNQIHALKLITPCELLGKYPRLRGPSKMGELAAKLARESFFGEEVMARSTVCGNQGYAALDPAKVAQLKEVIFSLFPQYACNPHFFEPIWKKCGDAMNHACSREREKARAKNTCNQ